MKYLTVCDHAKCIVNSSNAENARTLYICEKGCSARTYQAMAKDIAIVEAQSPATTKKKYKALNQTDWVSP